jgi:hypothetical protein
MEGAWRIPPQRSGREAAGTRFANCACALTSSAPSAPIWLLNSQRRHSTIVSMRLCTPCNTVCRPVPVVVDRAGGGSSGVRWQRVQAAAPPPGPIHNRTSPEPGEATGRPSPTTSARWGIASSRRVAGRTSIFAAEWMAFGCPLRLLPDDLSCRTIGARRDCRVGPGSFTPSRSQIRTGYSRIIRLVPSREGCRLPLNEGFLPANQLAQISGDDPPPSLRPHYRAFLTTTRQSAPLRRIGTFGLAVGAACAFSLGIVGKVLTFHTGA